MTQYVLPNASEAELDALIAAGDIAFDTTNDVVRVGDGKTLGGIVLADAAKLAAQAEKLFAPTVNEVLAARDEAQAARAGAQDVAAGVAEVASYAVTNAPGIGDRFLDQNNEIVARFDGAGLTLADELVSPRVVADAIGSGAYTLSGFGPGFRWTDQRGELIASLDATGRFVAAEVVGAPAAVALPAKKTRWRIASSHGGSWTANTPLSNGGSQASGTDRFSWTPNTDVQGVRFLFANGALREAGVFYPVGNAVQVCLGVEHNGYHLVYPRLGASSGQPISQGGRTGSWIGDGEIVLSDPVFLNVLPKGSTQYYRLHKKVAAGGVWPLNKNSMEVTWAGVGTTDAAYGAQVTDGSDGTAAHHPISAMQPFRTDQQVGGWVATAIIAEQVTPAPVAMITGDSISYGYPNDLGRGYIAQGLDAIGVGWHNDGFPGIDAFSLTQWPMLPAMLADYVDFVVLHCQTNPIYDTNNGQVRSVDEYKSSILKAAMVLLRADSKLVLTTILPRNTSTDNWSTYANQTPVAAHANGGAMSCEDVRVSVNNFLRDPGPGGPVAWLNANLPVGACAGVIDAATVVERNADGSALALDPHGQQAIGSGGRWVVNGQAGFATPDGIHPGNNVVPQLAAAVSAQRALFAL